jgi:hypothetical protein
MLRRYQVGCIALGRRAPAFGDFGPNTSARHQHLRREGANGAQRAENGQPNKANSTEAIVDSRSAPTNRANTAPQVAAPLTAPRTRATSSASDRRCSGELCSQRFGLIGISAVECLADRVDSIGDACKPGGEHVEEGRDTREQKYGRKGRLNDVGDRVEIRSGIVDAEHRWC